MSDDEFLASINTSSKYFHQSVFFNNGVVRKLDLTVFVRIYLHFHGHYQPCANIFLSIVGQKWPCDCWLFPFVAKLVTKGCRLSFHWFIHHSMTIVFFLLNIQSSQCENMSLSIYNVHSLSFVCHLKKISNNEYGI